MRKTCQNKRNKSKAKQRPKTGQAKAKKKAKPRPKKREPTAAEKNMHNRRINSAGVEIYLSLKGTKSSGELELNQNYWFGEISLQSKCLWIIAIAIAIWLHSISYS